MYERMLDKEVKPSFDDMLNYCGESSTLWVELDKFIDERFSALKLIRFPYGKDYGWSMKYTKRNKHICDVFAENGAFTAFFHITDKAMKPIYNDLNDYAKSLWDNKYPCSNGGWLNFRVLDSEQLYNLKIMICARMNTRL